MSLQQLDIQVINLDDCTERYAQVANSLAQANLTYRRLAAIDFRGTSVETVPDYDASAAQRQLGRGLNGAEIGCFKSHQLAAETFLASGKKFGLVLEDDAKTPDDAETLLNALCKELERLDPNNWAVLNLGRTSRKFFRASFEIDQYQFGSAFHYPMTTGAIVWNRQGAMQFLNESQTIALPVDLALRQMCLRTGTGLGVRPAMIPQSDAASVIDTQSDGAFMSRKGSGRIHIRTLFGRRKRQIVEYIYAARNWLAAS